MSMAVRITQFVTEARRQLMLQLSHQISLLRSDRLEQSTNQGTDKLQQASVREARFYAVADAYCSRRNAAKASGMKLARYFGVFARGEPGTYQANETRPME